MADRKVAGAVDGEGSGTDDRLTLVVAASGVPGDAQAAASHVATTMDTAIRPPDIGRV
jgi:hypothetical protein